MENKSVDVYLHHIQDAINRIERFMRGVRKEDFFSDDSMVSAAVVREFEIIGEAIAQMPDEFREKHTMIPWRAIIDMRNRLIHNYFSIDYGIVWKTASEDLPELKKQIEELIKDNKEIYPPSMAKCLVELG